MTFWLEFAYHAVRTVTLFAMLLCWCECVLAGRADRALRNGREE